MLAITKKTILTPEQRIIIRSRMEREHAGYYGPTGRSCGLQDRNDKSFCWMTSRGNILRVFPDGKLEVEGRRHGIPWQFLAGVIDPRRIPNNEWDFYVSRCSTRHPAYAGNGEDLFAPFSDPEYIRVIWTELGL